MANRIRAWPRARRAHAGSLIAVALLLGACGVGVTAQPPATPPAPAAGDPRAEDVQPVRADEPRWGMVIHGGAGTILRETMTPEREAEYTAALEQALRAGHAILARGGSALDAVEATVRLLEDVPLFNAGRGAVFTAEGTNELDASIMDGRTGNAGAVAGVMRVRHPITLARLVMERSPHVMMARDGAEAFGEQHGVELVDPSFFHTDMRWQQLERARAAERAGAASDDDGTRFGTVGAVALDQHGHLAAATSTGGMTNKRFGRIGDSPIIGAGNYADELCAVSATGHGEYFIRNVVAYDICARMHYGGASLANAANEVVMHKLVAQQAEGGVIAMDRHGNVAMPFNSAGMYRGRIDAAGVPRVAIYR